MSDSISERLAISKLHRLHHLHRRGKRGPSSTKAGSVDVLHCYYAHGKENENLQRRSYWLLEDCCRECSNIVFVHYREVKDCWIGSGSFPSSSS